MNEQNIRAAFAPYYNEFVNLALLEERPLLAHYTSLDSLEKITKSREMWFSNPLFMNDLQEIRFGMIEGRNIFYEEINEASFVKEFGPERALLVSNSFGAYYTQFDTDHALNLYIFCLSEHDASNNDGRLSMWRGYGGNGGGAAIIFNTEFVAMREESPLVIGKVWYATDIERREWIRNKARETKKYLKENAIADELLSHVSFQLFNLLKIHAIFSKHVGFAEEREWRVIYFPERDAKSLLSDGFTYIVGKNGVEPKLRFPIRPLAFENPETWTFEGIVDRIILGPSLSNFLATNAVKKMFVSLGNKVLAEKVIASGIPFRAT